MPEDRIIDCLIVYANQECPPAIPDKFDAIDMAKVNGYAKFRKIGIRLPVRK